MTTITISAMCMCCNERLCVTGRPGAELDAELDAFRRTEGWLLLPYREGPPLRPHPVDVCRACWAEIADAPACPDCNELGCSNCCPDCADATGGVCRAHQQPECTCYEAGPGHMPGCAFNRPPGRTP